MPRKRSYRQNCALAIAMDRIGERWTLLIVRELLIKPRRFGELLANLNGMGTNLLTTRLQQLQDDGLVEKRAPEVGHANYQLTAQGQKLEEIVSCLIRWGMQFPEDRKKDFQSRREWDILPLRAYFNPGAGGQWSGSYLLELDGETFHLAADGDQLRELTATDEKPVARLSLSNDLAIAISNGEISLGQALKDKQIPYSGRRRDVEAFFAAFSS
jgi:DNA-binding HxlR family transcriptional regulator